MTVAPLTLIPPLLRGKRLSGTELHRFCERDTPTQRDWDSFPSGREFLLLYA
jgi:hypothetical protein